jgi:hypothetical protein
MKFIVFLAGLVLADICPQIVDKCPQSEGKLGDKTCSDFAVATKDGQGVRCAVSAFSMSYCGPGGSECELGQKGSLDENEKFLQELSSKKLFESQISFIDFNKIPDVMENEILDLDKGEHEGLYDLCERRKELSKIQMGGKEPTYCLKFPLGVPIPLHESMKATKGTLPRMMLPSPLLRMFSPQFKKMWIKEDNIYAVAQGAVALASTVLCGKSLPAYEWLTGEKTLDTSFISPIQRESMFTNVCYVKVATNLPAVDPKAKNENPSKIKMAKNIVKASKTAKKCLELNAEKLCQDYIHLINYVFGSPSTITKASSKLWTKLQKLGEAKVPKQDFFNTMLMRDYSKSKYANDFDNMFSKDQNVELTKETSGNVSAYILAYWNCVSHFGLLG